MCFCFIDAFERLEDLYGSTTKAAVEKKGYHVPNNMMTNTDLGRIINSTEVQSGLHRIAIYVCCAPTHRTIPLHSVACQETKETVRRAQKEPAHQPRCARQTRPVHHRAPSLGVESCQQDERATRRRRASETRQTWQEPKIAQGRQRHQGVCSTHDVAVDCLLFVSWHATLCSGMVR